MLKMIYVQGVPINMELNGMTVLLLRTEQERNNLAEG